MSTSDKRVMRYWNYNSIPQTLSRTKYVWNASAWYTTSKTTPTKITGGCKNTSRSSSTRWKSICFSVVVINTALVRIECTYVRTNGAAWISFGRDWEWVIVDWFLWWLDFISVNCTITIVEIESPRRGEMFVSVIIIEIIINGGAGMWKITIQYRVLIDYKRFARSTRILIFGHDPEQRTGYTFAEFYLPAASPRFPSTKNAWKKKARFNSAVSAEYKTFSRAADLYILYIRTRPTPTVFFSPAPFRRVY